MACAIRGLRLVKKSRKTFRQADRERGHDGSLFYFHSLCTIWLERFLDRLNSHMMACAMRGPAAL